MFVCLYLSICLSIYASIHVSSSTKLCNLYVFKWLLYTISLSHHLSHPRGCLISQTVQDSRVAVNRRRQVCLGSPDPVYLLLSLLLPPSLISQRCYHAWRGIARWVCACACACECVCVCVRSLGRRKNADRNEIIPRIYYVKQRCSGQSPATLLFYLIGARRPPTHTHKPTLP